MSTGALAESPTWERVKGIYGGICYDFVVDARGRLHAFSQNGGEFLSTDWGMMWTSRDNVLATKTMPMKPCGIDSSGRLFALAGDTVYSSTDEGDTWTLQGAAWPRTSGASMYVDRRGFVYIYCSRSAGLFRSIDGGSSWSRLDDSLTVHSFEAVSVDSVGNILTFASTLGFLFSSDGGSTWQQRDSTTSYVRDIVQLSPDTILAVLQGEQGAGLFMSCDTARTWRYCVGSQMSDRRISVLPDGSIYLGEYQSIFKSTDRGITWSDVSSGIPGELVTRVVSCGRGVLVGCTYYHGIVRSTDDGQTWTVSNEGFSAFIVKAVRTTSQGMLIVATPGDVYLSSDNGVSWRRSEHGPEGQSGAMDIVLTPDDNIYLISSNSQSGLSRSTDQGETFTALPGNPLAEAAIYDSIGGLIIGSQSSGIQRTTDKGDSWISWNIGQTAGGIMCFVRGDEGRLLAGSGMDSGRVYFSDDHGLTWTLAPTRAGTGFTRKLVRTDFGIFASTGRGLVIYCSTDNGLTWEVAPGMPTSSLSSVLSTRAYGLLAGSSEGLFRTTDAGRSWSSFSAGLATRSVNDLAAGTKGNLFAATNGGGVFRLADGVSAVSASLDDVPLAVKLCQNYPNPFNPSTTIRYGLPSRSHVTLTVFNTLGQQVATLVQGEQEAGFHEAVFDASHLASGVYLYRLAAGSFVETKRLLLLR